MKNNDVQPASDRATAGGVAPHLSLTSREAALTAFEQALICAAEAFYRFAGSLLGPVARDNNLTGQDCVILQQLVVARVAGPMSGPHTRRPEARVELPARFRGPPPDEARRPPVCRRS